MTYSEKLKDPQWQKLRLKVFDRDGWACTKCGNTQETLVVHHLYYSDKDPWDYPLKSFMTLCETCHKKEHKKQFQIALDNCERQVMYSPLTKEIFKRGLQRLEAAFFNLLTPDSIKIYYERLDKYCNDKIFSFIVEEIIENENRFPTIAMLLRYRVKSRYLYKEKNIEDRQDE